MNRHYNIPIFIPEAACPHQCIFCNQRNITEKEKLPSVQSVIKIVERYLSTIHPEGIIEIAFFGGNFTGLPKERQIDYLQSVQHFLHEEKISSIRCSTRPDYIDDESIELLQSFGVKMVELGAQSFDDEVLSKSGRGHSSKDIYHAVSILKKHHMPFGLQMMTGLPGDTPEKALKTASEIVRLKANNTRIYPCLVIRSTFLEKLFLENKYHPQSIKEAIALCADLTVIFETGNVKILRTGLHRSAGFDKSVNLVAGPYHPSFKELVETELWRRILLKTIDFQNSGNIIITVPKGSAGMVAGHQKVNRKWLESLFHTVHIKENEMLLNRNYHVDYCR